LVKELNFWGLAETANITSLATDFTDTMEARTYNMRKLDWLPLDTDREDPTEKHVANWVHNLLLPETLRCLMAKSNAMQRNLTLIVQSPPSFPDLLETTTNWHNIRYPQFDELQRLLSLPAHATAFTISETDREIILGFLKMRTHSSQLYGSELFQDNPPMQQECIRLLALHGFTASFSIETYTLIPTNHSGFSMQYGVTFPLLMDYWSKYDTDLPSFIDNVAINRSPEGPIECFTLTLGW